MFRFARHVVLSLLVSPLFLYATCGFLPGLSVARKHQLSGRELELAAQLKQPTTDYLRDHMCFFSRGGKPFIKYEVIAIDESGDIIKEYAWFAFFEYIVANGRLENGSAGSFPVALTIRREGSSYKVIEGWQSIAGELDKIPESLRANVPAYQAEASGWDKVIREDADAYYRSHP
jgi:hypothetical protein